MLLTPDGETPFSSPHPKPPSLGLEENLLRKATTFNIWCLGVGTVISGNFFGWNFGLTAGFGGFLVAVVLVTVFYMILCACIAELSSSLPSSAGAVKFVYEAMGQWPAHFCGLAASLEYILTAAVVAIGVSDYLVLLTGISSHWSPLVWLILYLASGTCNSLGVESSYFAMAIMTVGSIGILCAAYFGCLLNSKFDFVQNAIGETSSSGAWFPDGVSGILGALPFAMWFFLGIEDVAVAGDECIDATVSIPRGVGLAMVTLLLLAFSTLFTMSSVAPLPQLAKSTSPLLDVFRTVFSESDVWMYIFGSLAMLGLLTSFHSLVYAYTRQLFGLARTGHLPSFMGRVTHMRKAPIISLLFGSVIGLAVNVAIYFLSTSQAGAVVINMSIFSAVLSYGWQLLAFVWLRVKEPYLERPYRNHIGIPGGVIGLLICLVILVSLLTINAQYRYAALGCLGWFLLGSLYFYYRYHIKREAWMRLY